MASIVALLVSTPSSGEPGDPVPGQEELPASSFTDGHGIVTASQGTVVRRSKMYLTIDDPAEPIWGVFYTNLWNTPAENPTHYLALCARGRPCVADPFLQPECATSDPATQERGMYLQNLLYGFTRKSNGGVDVGHVATTRVNMIAFGSIPATATLTLRLPRKAGKIVPLRMHVWDIKVAGCDPAAHPKNRLYSVLVGQIEITLADLRVDGVPVELGPSCRTVRPVDLQAWGTEGPTADGYTPGGGGLIEARDGIQGAALAPLDSPYYRQDNGLVLRKSSGIDIPEFVGCGTGGDDLSPLITAMASGPNNPLVIRQKGIVPHIPTLDLWDLERCTSDGLVCPLPGAPAPERPPLPEGDE